MSGDFRLAGVMGWPVAHSRSPLIHRFWLEALGMEGDYARLPVRPGALAAALGALPALGFAGVNLTVPHKVAALAHLDSVTPVARAAGAVNIVTVGPDGRLHGDNSDVAGVQAALDALPVGTGTPVALLGSGGAARAALAALAGRGVDEVRLVARDRGKAADLLAAFGLAGAAAGLEEAERACAGAVVVNATSLGMRGADPVPDALVAAVTGGRGLFDMVYAPLETPLLAAARAAGLPVADGLIMLVGQAAAAFAAFYGAAAPRERDAELRALLVAGR